MTELLSFCPLAGCTPQLATRTGHLRRGERVISYAKLVWRCASCVDPDTGEAPFEFVDRALMQRNEEAAAAQWREHYGEDLPPGQRPGRKSDAPKNERVTILFSSVELERLDALRGEQPRSEFIRQRVLKAS